MPPSISSSPSAAPTNMVAEDTAYILKYAGEVRTVIRHPFQLERNGEFLDMGGRTQYELCEVDEIEGRKVGFPNRMNFWLNGRCERTRGGNPTVRAM